MCVCFTSNKTVTFPKKNGDLPKRVVGFLKEETHSETKTCKSSRILTKKSYNNNGKPWKSSRILRVNPFFHFSFFFHHFLHFFVFFSFFHFFIFFIFSFFFFFQISFFFLFFFSFFFFFNFYFSSFFFIFNHFFHFHSFSFIFLHFLSFSFIFFHFLIFSFFHVFRTTQTNNTNTSIANMRGILGSRCPNGRKPLLPKPSKLTTNPGWD